MVAQKLVELVTASAGETVNVRSAWEGVGDDEKD